MEIVNATSVFSGWGVLGMFMLVGGLAACIEFTVGARNIGAIISGTIAICGIVLIIFADTIWKEPRYEVLLNGDSGYEYMMENYEVVEQRGKIWVVKEKE